MTCLPPVELAEDSRDGFPVDVDGAQEHQDYDALYSFQLELRLF